MKCPNCGIYIPEPTYKQIEAYRLVYYHGHSHHRAAKIIGLSRQAITKRLANLRRIRPDLVPSPTEKATLRKKITLDFASSYRAIHSF